MSFKENLESITPKDLLGSHRYLVPELNNEDAEIFGNMSKLRDELPNFAEAITTINELHKGDSIEPKQLEFYLLAHIVAARMLIRIAQQKELEKMLANELEGS